MHHYSVDFVLSNRIALADYYPYEEYQAATCRSAAFYAPNIFKQVLYYSNSNETLLKDIVSQEGPVVVLVRVQNGFLAYKSGIMGFECGTGCNGLNHAVVVVGKLKGFFNDCVLVQSSILGYDSVYGYWIVR